jgi:two-component system NarL family sensor kinase
MNLSVISPRANRGPPGLREFIRSFVLRGAEPSRALGVAVAAALITVETFWLLLARSDLSILAFAALYLAGVLVLSVAWGLALAVSTAVISGLALAYFDTWPAVDGAFLSSKTIVIVGVFVAVAVTTHVVSTRVREFRPGAEAEEKWSSLGRVARQHHSRRLRIGSLFRIGAVAILLAAMIVGTPRSQWTPQVVLIGMYAVAAIWAIRVSFSSGATFTLTPQRQLVFALADIAVVFGFQMLSGGGFLPMLVLALAPLMVVPEVSWRGAAVVMLVAVSAFSVALVRDPVVMAELNWPQTLFVIALYATVCAIALVAAYVEARHFDEIAALIISRETLLASTMTATDELQRGVAQSIHDGALQDIMVARQELLELAQATPSVHVDRALASLDETTTRLRQAVFVLHPVVVEQLGLGPAIEKLASDVSGRCGITITTEVENTVAGEFDSILFAAVRELLSNAVRHSNASRITVRLAVDGATVRLDVADNGIGLSPQLAAERIAEGHIGLASHRARVETANGVLTVVDEPVGTHIRIEMPYTPIQ